MKRPIFNDITAYQGDTLEFMFTIEDPNGYAVDLSQFISIEWVLSTGTQLSTTEGTLAINGNDISGTRYADEMEIPVRGYYYELKFYRSPVDRITWGAGQFNVIDADDQQGSTVNEFTLQIEP